jgi:hypothetical protein
MLGHSEKQFALAGEANNINIPSAAPKIARGNPKR